MEQAKKISENEINVELTEKIQKDPKYDAYKKWLKSKGVMWKDIDFPVAFGPAGIIGVAAAKDIPNCSGIICIPNEILVTTTKVQNGEMSKFVSKHPELFEDENDDAEFNLLAIFLVREKIKGKESDFEPLVNVIDNNTILLHWGEEIIQELEDPYIKKEAKEFEVEMDKTWEQFKAAFDEFPDLFPPDKVTKQIFFWAYEAVMTRCFGWSLPNTMLVPMADFMNHNPDGTTHYIVNRKFERDEEEAPENYVIKKRKVDLTVFNEEALAIPEEDKAIFYAASTERTNYIKRHADWLSEGSRNKFSEGNYRKEDLKKIIREINLNILKKDKNRQVWDVLWFESSDDEDNDTEEEDEDEEEEAGEDGKDTFESINKEEVDKLSNTKDKKFEDEESKRSPSKTTKASNKNEEDDQTGDDEADDEEEEEEEEEDETTKREREDYKFGKGILIEKFSPSKYMKHNVSEYEKQEMEKIKVKKANDEGVIHQPASEAHDDDDDDSDWDWFEDNDPENYFVVATHPYLNYKKGDQIYNCYGRRTNRFLLMWYGFCIKENRYNSLSFRLWMNKTTLSNTNPPKKILFKDYITEKEWNEKEVGEEKSSPQELTKEFRVKFGTFCQDVLAYLRAQLLLTYRGPDLQRILVTIPTSIPYEEFVIDYAISLFIEIKNQFKTSIYEDEELLKDLSMDFRKRFAIVYRLEQKKIADMQIKLLRILLHIIEKLKAGSFFKDAYMERLPDIERTEDEFIENRRRLSYYLKLLYHNYTL